ncbi:hypothetical protein BKA62DRAFT_718778 [Auriculariales sp. MPI-PUGE-AT-0066]|nr:hypothetical protein BKA62DRAFT_718778 [Auriculariales sp. MPI-PUGE-AT-0066]
MRAVSLLNRLRQIQLPQICVSSFTDHLGDALSASPGARRPLVAGVECTQRGQDVKPNTSLTTFPGILPLVIESRNVRLMPYIAEDDTALIAYLGLVQPLLVDLAQRDLAGRRCDPFRSGIAFQIHLTVWQAARISELIELLPNALREHVISVELKFVTQAFDHAPIAVAPAAEGDMDSEVPTSPRFTADEIVDAVLCLPALRSLWVDEVSETWAERVMLFTEHEVVRAARSKGLGQFRFVRFQGLPR